MNIWKKIAVALMDALFPIRCLICGAFYSAEVHEGNDVSIRDLTEETFSALRPNEVFKRLMNPFLCPDCVTGFSNIESPICPTCGVMFESREGIDHQCGKCIDSPKSFRIARAPGVYNEALMGVIHYFKYKGKIQLARPLGRLLFHAFIRHWDGKDIDLVLPVPLHINRFRKRGFNQAFLLIKDWSFMAEMLNIGLNRLCIGRDILVRSRRTKPQTGLSRNRRMSNIKNAFEIRDSARIIRKRILLVDDVYTTGATADECAKTLLQGGARQVDVLTLARTL